MNSSGSAVVKQVVRKRAPIFPFEPEDHYVPDNNSNNIISKTEIEPAPTAVERRQGYCLRPFKETGQQRYICVVCGKHYTTMYNMRQHRNIHTGSGLHSCRYCGRSFTHKHVWEVRKGVVGYFARLSNNLPMDLKTAKEAHEIRFEILNTIY